jgi:hypothetical protein
VVERIEMHALESVCACGGSGEREREYVGPSPSQFKRCVNANFSVRHMIVCPSVRVIVMVFD